MTIFFSPLAASGGAEVAPVEPAGAGWLVGPAAAEGPLAAFGAGCVTAAEPGGGCGFGGFRKYQPTITKSARANASATRAWSEISLTAAPRYAPHFRPHRPPHYAKVRPYPKGDPEPDRHRLA